MTTTSIWSGFSTLGLNHLRNTDDDWGKQDSKAHLYVALVDEHGHVTPPSQIPNLCRRDLKDRIRKILTDCKITMTVDTYLMLALELEVINDQEVTTVFPWQADRVCNQLPIHNTNTDTICRNVARYYHALFRKQVFDHNEKIRRFSYKAANTISYRAYAEYHCLKREERIKFKPANKEESVLQFDWSAAEWSLILQENGYRPPDDPYAFFSDSGLTRDAAKNIVLPFIYGAGNTSLHKDNDSNAVISVINKIRDEYPNVWRWRENVAQAQQSEFNGFVIDLGNDPKKRANHWAQTALQLCKWELLSRLVQADVHRYAAGDLHDQLMFHVPWRDTDSRPRIQRIVDEIWRPCFGRYYLKAKFGTTW